MFFGFTLMCYSRYTIIINQLLINKIKNEDFSHNSILPLMGWCSNLIRFLRNIIMKFIESMLCLFVSEVN